jgi:hypothetical protein
MITPATIREARPYLAISLIEQNLPKFSDMIIRRVGLDSFSEMNQAPEIPTTHIPNVYYPRNEELQGYLHGYNLLHDNYSYDPYTDDDSLLHDRHLHTEDSSEIHTPTLWLQSKSIILDMCALTNKSHRFHQNYIGSANGESTYDIGCVEGQDFRDLIQPDMISSNLLDYLFYSQFPYTQNQVAYINTEVSNAIIACNMAFDALISNDVLYGPLTHTCHIMLTTPIMIFGFCRGEHITGVITHAEIRETSYVLHKVTFLDSLKGNGAQSVEAILAFLQWLSIQKSIQLVTSSCHSDLSPTACMIRQRRYHPPDFLPDTGSQVNHGIYFYLMMTLLHLEVVSLSILTPTSVHQHTYTLYIARYI